MSQTVVPLTNTSNGADITFSGAASILAALQSSSVADNSELITAAFPGSVLTEGSSGKLGNTLTDPGVYTGWQLNFKLLFVAIASPPALSFQCRYFIVSVDNGSVTATWWIFVDTIVDLTGPPGITILNFNPLGASENVWHTVVLPISAGNAASFAASNLNNLTWSIEYGNYADTTNLQDPPPNFGSYPVSDQFNATFLQLEIPDVPTPPSIVFTGSGGTKVSGAADVTSSGFPMILFTGAGGVKVSSRIIAVLSVDVSGIYTLVQGQRYDTLYVRDSSEETIDVKIPDPFIKTAFIGG